MTTLYAHLEKTTDETLRRYAPIAAERNAKRHNPENSVMRIYMGCIIERALRNSSGMRWVSLTPQGYVRADTLAGVKRMIRKAVQS